ncbi:hypothetical protein P9112_011484 [Eukaryota sp. TZLM1-RC]
MLYLSSDSEDDLITNTVFESGLSPSRMIQFIDDAEPVPLYLLSMRDNKDLISHVVKMLKSSMDSTNPFISVDAEWRNNLLDVIQLGTPSMCVVLQIHQKKSLNRHLKELLTSSLIMKVFKAKSEDLKRIKQFWKVKVDPVFDIEDYFRAMGKLYQNRTGQGVEQIGKPSHPACTFAAHGFNCLLPRDESTTMSNWSAETLTQEQVDYAALDAYWIAFLYSIMNQYGIGTVPLPLESPCVYFRRWFDLKDPSPERRTPFRTYLPRLDSKSFITALRELKLFCCDVHEVKNDQKQLPRTSFEDPQFLLNSISLFTQFLCKVFSKVKNLDKINLRNAYSYLKCSGTIEPLELAQLASRIVCFAVFRTVGVSNAPDVFLAFSNHKRFALYNLTVAYYAFAEIVDHDPLSLDLFKTITLDESVFNVEPCIDFVDPIITSYCSILADGINNKLLCSGMNPVSVCKCNSNDENINDALNNLINSINLENPIVAVYACSTTTLLDTITFATDTSIVELSTDFNREINPLLEALLSNEAITKFFMGKDCPISQVGEFFCLEKLCGFVDFGNQYDSANNEFCQLFGPNLSLYDPKVCSSLPVYGYCDSYPLSPCSEDVTTCFSMWLLMKKYNLQTENSVPVQCTIPSAQPEIDELIARQKAVEKTDNYYFVNLNSKAVSNDADVLYHSRLLNVDVCHLPPDPADSKSNLCKSIGLYCLIPSDVSCPVPYNAKSGKARLTTLSALFVLERFVLKDSIFRKEYLGDVHFGPQLVVINSTYDQLPNVLALLPPELTKTKFLPKLTDWSFEGDKASFKIGIAPVISLHDQLQEVISTGLLILKNCPPTFEGSGRNFAVDQCRSLLDRFSEFCTSCSGEPDNVLFALENYILRKNFNVELFETAGLTKTDFLRCCEAFIPFFFDVHRWDCSHQFGPLVQLFTMVLKNLELVFSVSLDKKVPVNQQRSNSAKFLQHLLENDLFNVKLRKPKLKQTWNQLFK